MLPAPAMVSSAATSISQYLAEQEPERRDALKLLHARIKRALPPGYVDTMQYGMISFVVPLLRFPDTYNRQPLTVLALAAQKQHVAVYLLGLYGDPALRAEFERAYAATGKRLDMGKSCLRFKRLDDLAIDLVVDAASKVSVDDLIAMHEAAHNKPAARAKRAAKAAKKKSTKAR